MSRRTYLVSQCLRNAHDNVVVGISAELGVRMQKQGHISRGRPGCRRRRGLPPDGMEHDPLGDGYVENPPTGRHRKRGLFNDSGGRVRVPPTYNMPLFTDEPIKLSADATESTVSPCDLRLASGELQISCYPYVRSKKRSPRNEFCFSRG